MTETIWMINHFATPPGAPGGTRHYDFGTELAKRGYEVTIFASDLNYMLRKRMRRGESCIRPPTPKRSDAGKKGRKGDTASPRVPASPRPRVSFVWVRSLRYKKNNWRRAANMLSFALNVIAIGAVQKRPDVIIGSSPHLFAALSAYILAKFKGSRFYLEVRDLWPQTLIDMRGHKDFGFWMFDLGLKSKIKNRKSKIPLLYAIAIVLLRKIEALLYRVADRIIVLSEGAEKYIARRGIDPEKISLLPNGVYLEQFEVTESRANVRARLGLTDKFVVMYAGAHGSANALDTILHAGYLMLDNRKAGKPESRKAGEPEGRLSGFRVSSIEYPVSSIQHPVSREVAFVLVGDGPCKVELRQMIDEKGLNNVKMIPAVPKNSIPNLLNAADALVITLRSVNVFSYGVSPNKLFEYMASGKPILCAVDGEVASLVTRASAGIVVEPENPEALVQAILSLARDRKRCLVYGVNGQKFVEENFSRSRIAEGLVSMLGARIQHPVSRI